MSSRPRRDSAPAQLDADNVLRGRTSLTVVELMALIHRINPTPKGLDEARARDLYRTKAELQSLLIRDHGEVLRVVASPHQRGVVSLVYRYDTLDACHAIIDELDADARAWVLFQLDTRENEVLSEAIAPSSKSDEPQSQHGIPLDVALAASVAAPKELIRLGIEAIEEYEYDAAREWLTAALEQSGEDLETASAAALELLALLIDTLAAYDDALSLFETLPKRLRQRPELCILGAVAAARGGHIDEALALVDGHAGERAAETWSVLATQALHQGDFEGAESRLTEADRAVAAYSAAVLKAELADLRAQISKAAHAAEQDRSSQHAAQSPQIL